MQKQVEKYTGKWMFWKDVDKKRLSTFLVGMMWITLTFREIQKGKNKEKIGQNI